MSKLKNSIIITITLLAILILGSFIMNNDNEAVETMNPISEIPIYAVDKQEKVAAITFDINWAENEYLYSILDILDKYNVKATFFVMGGWINQSDENVEKLKTLVERGHEIGNHSYLHPSFTKIGEDKIKEELKKTNDIIEKYTSIKVKLFRFPSGDYNSESVKVVENEGYIPIQWNCDSIDWREEGAEIEYSRIKENFKPGSILLFHNNAKYTPENLDKIIKEFQQEGYKFVPIGELIYYDEYIIEKDGTQFKK